MFSDLGIKSTLKEHDIPFILPNNWTWFKWEDLITEYQQGIIRSNRELNKTGVPYLKMNNLDNNGGYKLNYIECTDVSQEELKKYRLHENDFLINVRNSKELVGKTCVIGKLDFDLVFNHMLVRIKHHKNISSIYINALLNTPVMRRFIDRCKKGTTTVIALYQKDLYDIPIPIPDTKTQRAISKFVENISRKIELNNCINAKMEAMAKTLYDYWFVQFDFPDKNGKPYKSSGGKMAWNAKLKREIPEGWSNGIASDMFIFNPSLSFSKDTVGSYIDMSALPTSGFMTDEVQKKTYNGGVKFQNSDVVIARITPCLENGKTGLITLLKKDEVGFGSTEFIVLRGKRQPLSSFAACLSRSELFRKFAIANMTGTSGRKRVESKTLETFGMPIPPNKLLSKFEETVAPFFKAATVNTKQNQLLSSLRDWLLPMLMNGQVKVS